MEKVEKSDKAVRCEADHRSLTQLLRIGNPAQRVAAEADYRSLARLRRIRNPAQRFAVKRIIDP